MRKIKQKKKKLIYLKRKILKPKVRKNLKTITSKERIKIDESSQDLNNNNNHVINDNILNKEKEIKNYVDKI